MKDIIKMSDREINDEEKCPECGSTNIESPSLDCNRYCRNYGRNLSIIRRIINEKGELEWES